LEMQEKRGEIRMIFSCKVCSKRYVRKAEPVDEYIECACGYRFYVFYDRKMTVQMPATELAVPETRKALQRFVKATGRCPELQVESFNAEMLRNMDQQYLCNYGLHGFQLQKFSKCYLNADDIASICESLAKKQDVMIRDKGYYTQVMEMNVKAKKVKEGTGRQSKWEEAAATLHEGNALRPWQEEIMEQDKKQKKGLFGK